MTALRERYARYQSIRMEVRERQPDSALVSEHVVQCIWYDQIALRVPLRSTNGQALRVLSPGWWNHSEGPDFRGAQIEFDGVLITGDVEIHLKHAAWQQHGHHVDSRYNDVMLLAVLESESPSVPPCTASGRPIPVVLLRGALEEDIGSIAERLTVEDYPYRADGVAGLCSSLMQTQGRGFADNLISLAGEWRMLSKARLLRERMDRVGPEQALYEAFVAACGYSSFKSQFRTIAQQFHYDRACQLGRQDPFLLETALFHLSGLLPEALPAGTDDVRHYERLHALRKEKLPGLGTLPLAWQRLGTRPNNYPERRLAGIALFLARTAAAGLLATLTDIWNETMTPLKRRQAFEALFPKPMGFWATRCSWTGKVMDRPCALLGKQRIRSIIGNVFVPAALAVAHRTDDRRLEERVLEFYGRLPGEADNKVLNVMFPRVLGHKPGLKVTFRLQQGLLQLHQDWCVANPSCHECSVLQFLGAHSGEE